MAMFSAPRWTGCTMECTLGHVSWALGWSLELHTKWQDSIFEELGFSVNITIVVFCTWTASRCLLIARLRWLDTSTRDATFFTLPSFCGIKFYGSLSNTLPCARYEIADKLPESIDPSSRA